MNYLQISLYTLLVLLTLSCGGLTPEEKAAGKSEKADIKKADEMVKSVSAVQQVSNSMIPVLKEYNDGTFNKSATKINNGITIRTIKDGEGNRPQFGDNVFVHYYGVLPDGYKFDSTFDRMKPFTFKLGSQDVIPGWNDAISRMRTGGSYVVVVPPTLAYGLNGRPQNGIPANTDLIFYIALLGFQ